MCYNPLTIVNPRRFVSISSREQFLLRVPCGRCAQCRQQKSDEWSFRLLEHSKYTFDCGGFMYFDTLTYAPQYLPHISDFYPFISSDVDYPCFNYIHLRKFVARLRQRCKRIYSSNFSYFIAAEYGTDKVNRKSLHRPHYHGVFFVTGSISPVEFSKLVSDCWFYGLTDGIPYKSPYYVNHNSFLCGSAGALRSIKYVCKYVQKSSKFESEIKIRVDSIMNKISEHYSYLNDVDNDNVWKNSTHYWRVRESIIRKVGQFHRQSTYLGASYLSECDIESLMQTGCVTMIDNASVVKTIPLPTYYKRKLFYDLFDVDGSKFWIANDDGIKFNQMQIARRMKSLRDKLKCYLLDTNKAADVDAVCDYELNYFGRIKGTDDIDYLDIIANYDYTCYVTRYDKEYYGNSFLSPRYLGNSYIGRYKRTFAIPIFVFIKKYIHCNSVYDKFLEQFYYYSFNRDSEKQALFCYKQHLENLVHHYF